LGKTFEEKINPEIDIPKAVSAVHHIYNSDVENARVFKAVWLSAEEFIQIHLQLQCGDVIIVVGHNVKDFDLEVIKAEFARVDLEIVQFRACDTLILARLLFEGIVKERTAGFFKLEYLAPLLGITVEHAHDAAGDVLVNSQLFDQFITGIDQQKVYQAMIQEDSERHLAKLIFAEGLFNPKHVLQSYEKACAITIPLAQHYLGGILGSSYIFEPKNLAAFLDVSLLDYEKEPSVLWKIFLTLTKDVDRAAMLKIIKSSEPFHSLVEIIPSSIKDFLTGQIDISFKATTITLALGKQFFANHNIPIEGIACLAKYCKVSISQSSLNASDIKRIFLKLTQGLEQKTVHEALKGQDPINSLFEMIAKNGTFSPQIPTPTRTKRAERPNQATTQQNKFARKR
jgi:DNA polymerase III epsilon subunit-like protein